MRVRQSVSKPVKRLLLPKFVLFCTGAKIQREIKATTKLLKASGVYKRKQHPKASRLVPEPDTHTRPPHPTPDTLHPNPTKCKDTFKEPT